MKTTYCLAAAAAILGACLAVQAAGTRGGGKLIASSAQGSTVQSGVRNGARANARPTATQGATSQRAEEEATELPPLREALELLKGADHDYDGHRVKAIKAIEDACKLLRDKGQGEGGRGRGEGGEKLKGSTAEPASKPATKTAGEKHDKEPEAQSVSDQQLTQAKTLVEGVVGGIPSGKEPRITELLNKAVEELTTALSIK